MRRGFGNDDGVNVTPNDNTSPEVYWKTDKLEFWNIAYHSFNKRMLRRPFSVSIRVRV
jgi:hypothetical protein